ncbi:MAG: hypothetical protein WB919_00440 [Candidatus Sulfotelmatobacter sp.]
MNLKFGWNRRSFLAVLGAAGSSLLNPARLSAAGIFGKKPKLSPSPIDGGSIVPITIGLGSTGNIYAELGVTPLININGTVTVMGGSVVRPEVMELIRRGNEHFVLIDELEVPAGKLIANLCKSPPRTGGKIDGMIVAAGKILSLADNSTKILPGHGPLGSKADLTRSRDMLVVARDCVQKTEERRQIGLGSRVEQTFWRIWILCGVTCSAATPSCR